MGDEVSDKTDLERVGLFIDGPYDTDVTLFRPDVATLMGRNDDEPDDPLRLDGPFPILPGHKLKAATNDWTFTPFLSLWEDVPYEDPGEWRRRYEAEKAEGAISDQVYNSTVGEKSMNGLGTYYGTFIAEMEAFSPEVRENDGEDPLAGLSNFLTKPPKKGTGYGYVDVCINPYPEHEDDPDFDSLEARQAMREEFEAGMVDGVWIPTAHPGNYFDPNPYFDEKDPDGDNQGYDFDRLLDPNASLYEDNPPWIPSNTTKKINGNKDVMLPFEKFPEYDPSDPWEPPPVNIFRQTKLDEDEEKPPWKAQFGNRSRQTKSVLNYNLNLRVNSTNFHLF